MRKSAAREPEPGEAKYRVQVLERAFDILDALAADGPGRLNDLSRAVDLHKSTTHRLLSAMERRRYVERMPSGAEYALGLRLFELGTRAVSRLGSVEIARPFLERLAQASGETAHMGILRQGEIISLVNAESRHALHTPATVGGRTPVHCTSLGKAILAFSPETAVREIARTKELVALTPKTITSMRRLKLELQRIRARGYAVDDEEFEAGLRCVGAAVRDHTNKVVAAISIAGPIFRVSRKRVPQLGGIVKRTAAELSFSLGYSTQHSNGQE
jgi:DNA-binding IclR family transcriptional regulator